jgi:transposase
MHVLVSRCAGIDIGKAEVVVLLRVPGSRGKRLSQVRTFSAVTGDVNGWRNGRPNTR